MSTPRKKKTPALALPDGSGLDLCRSWRATPVGAQCTCLALSADVMPEQVSQAMAAGVDRFLAKPLDLGELAQALVLHATRATGHPQG